MHDEVKIVQALQKTFKGDLTSFQGMLNYERSLRSAMGKLKNKWPTGLKVHVYVSVREGGGAGAGRGERGELD